MTCQTQCLLFYAFSASSHQNTSKSIPKNKQTETRWRKHTWTNDNLLQKHQGVGQAVLIESSNVGWGDPCRRAAGTAECQHWTVGSAEGPTCCCSPDGWVTWGNMQPKIGEQVKHGQFFMLSEKYATILQESINLFSSICISDLKFFFFFFFKIIWATGH